MRSSPHSPFIIGLTGGIGSGKTAVSDSFAALGVEVIDADVVSRAVVAPGEPVLQQLSALTTDSIVRDDGSLDRSHLRQLMFGDAELKQAVEQLLHPLIRRRILQQIQRSHSRLLLLVVPLLLESSAYDFVDRVLVVDVPEALQISRTAARDNTTPAEVARIMRSQMPRAERLRRADDVIHNDGDLAALQQQVAQLHRRYEELAMNQSGANQPPRYVNCPTCRKQVAWVESEKYRPFCSRKCQLIDFGEWASERHSIPGDETPAGDEPQDPVH